MTEAENTATSGKVISVNIGAVREVEHNGRLVETGIFKRPTTQTQRVEGVHIGSDVQADTQAHGGYDKAIYAYAAEDYNWWTDELGQDLDAAFFGENLTTEGIDVSAALVGDRWRIGTALLEVSEPRVPCFKLGIRTGVSRIQQRFSKADRPGAYLRIIEAGELTVGDAITVTPAEEPSISMADVAAIHNRDRGSASRMLSVAGLSDAWRRWAAVAVEQQGSR